MKYFFTTLNNLEISGLDNEFVEIIPGIIITANQEIKQNILSDYVINAIGLIESNHILHSKNLIYYKFEDNDEFVQDGTNLHILTTLVVWLDDLLKNSWLLKDNCIDCDTLFLIDHPPSMKSELTSLTYKSKHTLSHGGIDDITLTKQELIDLGKINDTVESYLCEKESLSLKFMMEKSFSRIGRSLSFIKQARNSINLAFKISNYCSALETLFTTDSSELSHKLSERVAFFLNPEFSNKIEIYRDVKKAYNIRSKLTHGDYLKNAQIDELPYTSEKIDDILRKSISKILNNKSLLEIFDSSNEKIDSYFENLIFNNSKI